MNKLFLCIAVCILVFCLGGCSAARNGSENDISELVYKEKNLQLILDEGAVLGSKLGAAVLRLE